MPIDTDVQSFTEENANITDCNTKITQLSPLVLNTVLTSADNNKIPVRRSGVWSIEGEEAYNGYYQDFGNISGEVVLTMNGDSCRTAMTATIIGNTFVTGFGENFSTGVVYLLLVKQNGTGGYTVRWPYGASVLKQVGTSPDQITEVYIVKLPSGKIFIKCEAFQNTTQIGAVIKEFEFPNITYPDGSQAPMSFTWSKSAAVGHGGTVTGLYSDWEIADDVLYTNLLFSSYNNTTDLYSIQVVLTQAGTIYMRTRYGGLIGGTPIVSDWDQAVVELSNIDGDKYWDQTVLCINANKYGWEGSRKIVDEKGWNSLTLFGDTKVTAVSDKWAVNFDGTSDYAVVGSSGFFNFLHNGSSWTFEFFVNFSDVGSGNTIFDTSRGGTATVGGIFIIFESTGKLRVAIVRGVDGTYVVDKTFTEFTFSTGTDYHIAFTFDYSLESLNCKMYVNGELKGSGDKTANAPASTNCYEAFLGAFSASYPSNMLSGKLYSLRITNNICRYTSDFQADLADPYFQIGNLWWTPEPKYISNEKFNDYYNWDKTVCCINGYGVADSTNIIDSIGNAITLSGDTKISVANNLSYINFDGAGDTLNLPFSLSYLAGSYDFCLEFFYKAGSTATGTILSDASSFGGYYSIRIDSDTSGTRINVLLYDSATTLINIPSSVLTTYGNIVHAALVRNGTNILLFINGASAGSATITAGRALYSAPANLKLGLYGNSQHFTGGIYSFRISMFARYTTSFTVPDLTRPYFITKPKVENWAETSLVVNAYNLPVNSTDILDAKRNVISVFGDTKIAVDSNGLQYIKFDGTGDYITCSSGVFNPSSDGWCIDLFVSYVSYNGKLVHFHDATSNGLEVYVDTSGYLVVNNSVTGTTAGTINIPLNTLSHIRVCRVSGNIFGFVNGIQCLTHVAQSYVTPTTITFGRWNTSSSYDLNGRIYSVRLASSGFSFSSNFNVDLTNPYFPAIDSISDLWLDANDYSKMTLATGVSKIVDKSGNMREAIQNTAASQPALVQNAQNGLMALNFDGTDDGLAVTNSKELFKYLHNRKGTVLLIVKIGNSDNPGVFYPVVDNCGGTSTTVGFNVAYRDDIANNGLYWIITRGAANSIVAGTYSSGVWNTAYSNKFPPNRPVVLVLGFDPANAAPSLRILGAVDGVDLPAAQLLNNAASSSNASYDLQIGTIGGGGSFLLGRVYEAIIIPFEITKNFENMLFGYSSHKWGLTANLPANHPYKTTFPTEDFVTDDYWYNTVLCINGTDIIRPTEIIDSSRKNKITVYGDCKALIDSNNKQYINFDGTGDYLTVKDSVYLRPVTEDYTVECFFYVSVINAVNNFLIIKATSTGHSPFTLTINGSGYLVGQFSSNTPTQYTITGTTVIQVETLYHAAIVKNGNVFNLFLNGVIEGTSTQTITLFSSTSDPVCVGATSNGLYPLNGRIYSTRVTKGIARYTENFSVDLTNPYFPKKLSSIDIGSFGPDAWFDSSDASSIIEVDGRISQWNDKSGNNYHATQTTSGNRPVINSSLFNGYRTVYFDGTSRFLNLGTALGTIKPANFSVFVVGKFAVTSSKTNMLGSMHSTGNAYTCWGDIGTARTANDGKIEYSFGIGSSYSWGVTTNSVIETNKWFSGGFVYSGGSLPKWFVDGLEVPVSLLGGTATGCGGTAYSYCLGRSGDYNGQYLNGNIAEVLIFKRALTEQEVYSINIYFKNKWGV